MCEWQVVSLDLEGLKTLEGELKGDRLVRLNRIKERLEKLKSSGIECSGIEKLVNSESDKLMARKFEPPGLKDNSGDLLGGMQGAVQFFWRSVSFGLDKAESALETAENRALAMLVNPGIRNRWLGMLSKNDQFLREKSDRLASIDSRIFRLGVADSQVDKMNRQVQNIQDNCQRMKLRLPNPSKATAQEIDLLNEQTEIFYEDTDAQCDKLEEDLLAKEEEVHSGHSTNAPSGGPQPENDLWDQLNTSADETS